jgi:putative membrane protein
MEAYEQEPAENQKVLVPHLLRWTRLLWYGITWPSAVITLGLGLTLIFTSSYQYQMPDWLWIKLAFVLGLYGYHFACHSMFIKLQRGQTVWSSQKLRFWNEVATIFLFAIVFLVILRSALSMVYGLIGLLVFVIVLMSAITLYKKLRTRKS